MDKYSIYITTPAEEDMNNIVKYIAFELLEPSTAKKQIERLKGSILSLETMPERQPVINDEYLAVKGYRLIKVDNYLIFYRTDETKKAVYIIRVLSERRNWQAILK